MLPLFLGEIHQINGLRTLSAPISLFFFLVSAQFDMEMFSILCLGSVRSQWSHSSAVSLLHRSLFQQANILLFFLKLVTDKSGFWISLSSRFKKTEFTEIHISVLPKMETNCSVSINNMWDWILSDLVSSPAAGDPGTKDNGQKKRLGDIFMWDQKNKRVKSVLHQTSEKNSQETWTLNMINSMPSVWSQKYRKISRNTSSMLGKWSGQPPATWLGYNALFF